MESKADKLAEDLREGHARKKLLRKKRPLKQLKVPALTPDQTRLRYVQTKRPTTKEEIYAHNMQLSKEQQAYDMRKHAERTKHHEKNNQP